MSIAHYNLLERIGDGGLGDTYRARDTRVGRTVALKLVSADVAPDADSRSRLLGEAQDRGQAVASRTFRRCSTSAKRTARSTSPTSTRRAVRLLEEMAGAADESAARARTCRAARRRRRRRARARHHPRRPASRHHHHHPEGQREDSRFRIRAMDPRRHAANAGGARAPTGCRPTRSSVLAYLSPEQALGGAVDSRTDVFSLGVIIYEMLTGRNPFAAPTAAATVVNVIQGPVPPPHRGQRRAFRRSSSGSWCRRSPATSHSGSRAPRCSPRSCAASLDSHGAAHERADRRRNGAAAARRTPRQITGRRLVAWCAGGRRGRRGRSLVVAQSLSRRPPLLNQSAPAVARRRCWRR